MPPKEEYYTNPDAEALVAAEAMVFTYVKLQRRQENLLE